MPTLYIPACVLNRFTWPSVAMPQTTMYHVPRYSLGRKVWYLSFAINCIPVVQQDFYRRRNPNDRNMIYCSKKCNNCSMSYEFPCSPGFIVPRWLQIWVSLDLFVYKALSGLCVVLKQAWHHRGFCYILCGGQHVNFRDRFIKNRLAICKLPFSTNENSTIIHVIWNFFLFLFFSFFFCVFSLNCIIIFIAINRLCTLYSLPIPPKKSMSLIYH